MPGHDGLMAARPAAMVSVAGRLGWRAVALACCVALAGCASGERTQGDGASGERPAGGGTPPTATAPKPAAAPPQRAGAPAKTPPAKTLPAEPPLSQAAEVEEADPLADTVPPTVLAPRAQADQVGLASWYGGKFHRRRTASGELFDMRALTAAHPTLPFGSLVCVRSTVNGRTVVVRINDRGPHTGNRVIDLSRAAAEELGMIGLGLKPVELFALDEDEKDCPGP